MNYEITEDFIIEDLGIIEDYVYDIEVEETHSFFANNILVHNSVYYQIENFVIQKFGEDVDFSSDEVIDWMNQFEIKIIQKIIADAIDEYSEVLNIADKSQIGVEREIIADAAVFVAKKKYFARVRDSEGVRYPKDDPYIKIMGLEVARSSTPNWVKDRLEESIGVILDSDARGVKKWRDEVKSQFKAQPIEDISMTAGVSSLDYNLGDKGIPQGSKAALIHNEFIKNNGLEGAIEALRPGEKYKRCYLKQPNRFGSEVISWGDERISQIIAEDDIYDYSLNFEKFFENPLENMTGGLGFDITDKPQFLEW